MARSRLFKLSTLVVLLSLATACCVWQKVYAPLPPRKIAVFGSSVASGSVDKEVKGGYGARLGALLAPRGWELVNVSKGGDNTITIQPRYNADLLPAETGYVIIGLSLANEGLAKVDSDEHRNMIYSKWKDGVLDLMKRMRADGMRPIVANCYANGYFPDNPRQYDFTRKMNLDIATWDVPSINLLGAIDNGKGGWAQGHESDAGHPNAAGHHEMFLSIVPSLFDAMEQGKPRPVAAEGTGGVQIPACAKDVTPLSFTPSDTMHSFATSFWVRISGKGVYARVGTKSPAKMIELAVANPSHSALGDGGWHHVVFTQNVANKTTALFIDGKSSTKLSGSIIPTRFTLGGTASAEFRDWCVYRSSLNPDEVVALGEGTLLQSSLEVYAPLRDENFEMGGTVENRAQSLSQVVVGTEGLKSIKN